jgi:FAD/FMN-containing dehydrogenase
MLRLLVTFSTTAPRSTAIDPQVPPPPKAALRALRDAVSGAVIVRGDDAFPAAVRVWNGARQGRPAVVVACADAADVAAAVRFAHEAGLPLAARGGGYAPSGASSCPDGVVVDTRRLRMVDVDRATRTAVVGAGTTWGDVDPVTQRVGMVVPGLPLSGIGVAGSTIGGGYGHLRRAYGLACDNLLSAELITAEGASVVATGDRNSDLLWGLRGGGGNFGVLTSLTFRLSPLPDPVMCGALIFSAERAGELLRFYRDYTATLRDDVSTRFVLIGEGHSTVVADTIGAPRPGPLVAISIACVGHPAEAAALVRPLRQAGPALLDLLTVRPYTLLQAGAGPAYPAGIPALVGSHFLGALDDDVIAAICESFEAMPANSCDIHIDHMGGKVGRVAQMSTAAPNRGAPYLVSTMARWPAGAEGAAHRTWHEATEARVDKHAVGGPYVGMTSARVSSEQVYGRERYVRLAALKRRYDPDNLFTGNQNVTPLT